MSNEESANSPRREEAPPGDSGGSVAHAIARLKSLTVVVPREDADKSGPRLMEEYLHRMAQWCTALGTRDTSVWPFGDVAAELPMLDEADRSYETVVPHALQQAVEEAAHSFRERLVLRGYAHWVMVSERHALRNAPAFAHLPNPYEPLIRLLERGNRFHVENAIVDVGSVGIMRRMPEQWVGRRLEPLPSFSDTDLDAFDRAKRERMRD